MKQKLRTILLMLGILSFMPSICFAGDYRDSILMSRVWAYHTNVATDLTEHQTNTYLSYGIDIKRRNFLLWLIPSMYSIAHGDKQFAGEFYGKLKFYDLYNHDLIQQVKYGTIYHYREPMPALFDLLTPNIYSDQFYGDRLLSPFRYVNRRYYKYKMLYVNDSTAILSFKPRINNTQLVNGEAKVNFRTGAIDSLNFKGEFDMLKFNINTKMNPDSPYGMAKVNDTKASFKFVWNNVQSEFTTVMDCPITLPDSINDIENLSMMDSIRPIPLNDFHERIYRQRFREQEQDSIENEKEKDLTDSIPHKPSTLSRVKDFFWDVVGDHMMNSTRIYSKNTYMRISPLFNPFYMSYSTSKGLSYKLRGYLTYKWNDHRYLEFEPSIGWNIKINQFYYNLPFSMTYNPKRGGVAGITWGNGNRISNGPLAEVYNERVGKATKTSMPEFRDEYVSLFNNIGIFDWIHLMTGINYHIRSATTNWEMMKLAGLQPKYRSFAPNFTIRLMPWQTRGPVLTANYERSIMNVLGSNLQYERWEYDAVYKKEKLGMRILNLRAGAGFYTNRSTDYFVDYTNFYDNNLPTGWEDDWSGQFQLVKGRWYNESSYYVRGHISYDSPLLALSWLPWVGRFVETERLYFSALGIEHTRPYFEVGYGLRCRYLSFGVFASFLNTHFDSFEFKSTFELFRRW